MGGYLGGGEMSIVFAQPWGSALRAGVLSSCFAKKKVAKEEGDPKVGALRVPSATRQAGRLAKLAFGSDNASRRPPARLRCSAPLKGTPKASGINGRHAFLGFFGGRPQYSKQTTGADAGTLFGSPCAAPSNGAGGGKRARTV